MNVDKNIKIMVVDDADVSRRMLLSMIKELGFKNVTHASNGSKAWKKILEEYRKHNKFDLIISDINMPEMDGLELLHEVKNHRALKTTHVLLVSTIDEAETILHAANHGASNYIIKPFSKEILLEKINSIFSSDSNE